jgi:hypothetical protein
MAQCMDVPWGGIPPCRSHSANASIQALLYLPYHQPKVFVHPEEEIIHRTEVEIVEVPTKLNRIRAVSDWRAAKAKKCDCTFWGPSAFSAPETTSSNRPVLDPLHETTVLHSISSSQSTCSSHLSAQLGAGVGNRYLGATVSGKFDRMVQDNATVSRSVR